VNEALAGSCCIPAISSARAFSTLSQSALSVIVQLKVFRPEFFTLIVWGEGLPPDSEAIKDILNASSQVLP